MVFVLKPHSREQKGVVMFTHKERQSLLHAEQKYPGLIKKMAQDNYVGMHFGWHADNPKLPEHLNFVMSGNGVVNNLSDKVLHIKKGSRDFIPSFFGERPRNQDTIFWDIVCMSHNGHAKRLDEFLLTMRKVMDRRPETKILLVTSGPMKQKEPKFYASLRKDYHRLFNEQERKLFSIIDYRREKNELYALGYQAVPWILNSARIFTLFSQEEGGPKVVSESLISGTPVVARKQTKGGTLDDLNEENSALFNDIDHAADIFIEKLNAKDEWAFDKQVYIEKLREDYSFEYLKAELQKLHGAEPFDLDFKSNLARLLPAHDNVMPADITNTATDDLNSPAAIKLFIDEEIYGVDTPCLQRSVLLLKARAYVFKKNFIPALKNMVKAVLIKLGLWSVR